MTRKRCFTTSPAWPRHKMFTVPQSLPADTLPSLLLLLLQLSNGNPQCWSCLTISDFIEHSSKPMHTAVHTLGLMFPVGFLPLPSFLSTQSNDAKHTLWNSFIAYFGKASLKESLMVQGLISGAKVANSKEGGVYIPDLSCFLFSL